MPSRLVKQPNGLYACFSSVVDDFTAYGMDQQEALDFCRDHLDLGPIASKVKVANADLDLDESGQKGRWEEALWTIREIHGPAVEQERIKQILGELGECAVHHPGDPR